MNKREIVAPLLVIGLTILFAGICMAVFLSNGKSKKWVARKMKIGGMLLSLTAVSVGSGCTTCYDQPSPGNIINYDNPSGYELEILLDTGSVITGTISKRLASDFSFAVADSLEQNIQIGPLVPSDGAFDDYEEKFKIKLDTGIRSGQYWLKIFPVDTLEQENSYPVDVINLLVRND